MLSPRDSVNDEYFNFEKGERGVKLSTKRQFLKLRKNADRKRLFCSNVSTFLSLIVVLGGRGIFGLHVRHVLLNTCQCYQESLLLLHCTEVMGTSSQLQQPGETK